MMVNPDVDGYTKTVHIRKILRKMQKKQHLTENQKNTQTESKLSGGPVFIFSLPGGGRFALLVPVSFATAFHQYKTTWLVRTRVQACGNTS